MRLRDRRSRSTIVSEITALRPFAEINIVNWECCTCIDFFREGKKEVGRLINVMNEYDDEH